MITIREKLELIKDYMQIQYDGLLLSSQQCYILSYGTCFYDNSNEFNIFNPNWIDEFLTNLKVHYRCVTASSVNGKLQEKIYLNIQSCLYPIISCDKFAGVVINISPKSMKVIVSGETREYKIHRLTAEDKIKVFFPVPSNLDEKNNIDVIIDIYSRKFYMQMHDENTKMRIFLNTMREDFNQIRTKILKISIEDCLSYFGREYYLFQYAQKIEDRDFKNKFSNLKYFWNKFIESVVNNNREICIASFEKIISIEVEIAERLLREGDFRCGING